VLVLGRFGEMQPERRKWAVKRVCRPDRPLLGEPTPGVFGRHGVGSAPEEAAPYRSDRLSAIRLLAAP
jgi:hypothetical protein